MKFVLTANDAADVLRMGGKAAALARLFAEGFQIPAWFVISPQAFDASLTDAQRQELNRASDPSETQKIARCVSPSNEVLEAIRHAMTELLPSTRSVAVRSSAVDEDGSEHSFAGQLESFLFVSPEQVTDRVKDVWRSGFTDRIAGYRSEYGLTGPPVAPAVLIQKMVDAEVSGVAFAVDPIGGSRSTIVISSVFGLGTALVGGEADADTYRLDRTGRIIEERIAHKTLRHVCSPGSGEGVRSEPLPAEMCDRSTLDAATAKRIADLVLAVSRHEGRPQDIEWALHGGDLYLLQSRPITSLREIADPDGVRAIWDNSNIVESYAGITTPLTFTFARLAYEGVYREFCRIMKVPRAVIAANDAIFSQMLGLVRGRVYYNLLNWYRLIAMLPGFSVNQRFMEQMMGVREALPPEIAAGVLHRTWSQRQSDRLRLAWSVAGLAWNHIVLPSKIAGFYRRLNAALASPVPPLEEMRLDQLAAEFRKLQNQLLTRWDAPIINDFLAMIFFGTLGKLVQKWCGNLPNLQNDLIADEGGIISTEPPRRIAEMGRIAAGDERLITVLCGENPRGGEAMMAANAQLKAAYDQYLSKFGDRCLEELKLESSTLCDDPTPLLRAIGHTARRLQITPAASTTDASAGPRSAAERQVAQALKGHPLRRILFNWVMKHARSRVRDRENLRFERTRLFGRIRRIFVEIGRRLYADGVLPDARDVFYLNLEEIVAFVEGTSTCEDLGALSLLRKRVFERYRELAAPADRFETRGAVYLGNRFESRVTTTCAHTGAASNLCGIGCCPGIVKGPVRIIRDPRDAQLRHGEILVAERTDPGWVMLFPAAAGILVERGSLLSHSAIVAREMGIPAVVSVPNLTRLLHDGQHVEMDGSSGMIRVLNQGGPG